MSVDSADGSVIAVVGMAGRFPGARSVDEFWRNVSRGVESVKYFTDEELLAIGEAPETLADPAYVKAWPVLDDIELFDAGFFGMSPRDAAVMDPQHRFFLEVTWEAMEDAGYDPDSLVGPVGVFATNGMNTYMMHHLVTSREVMQNVGEWLARHTGNDMNFLATRVSYQMNLKGPSLNVQTACSSALVAVHLACQSLLSGESDMALAGASAFSMPQDRGYLYHEGEILSRDGHCRPFDAGSRGTLFGSGAGCLVLKRLSSALADGDQIRALIRGTAINNDGSIKIGYLAPSVDGQARAIAEAIAISGVDPEGISYIEAHGTGTAVGDPIEIAALTQAFRAHTEKRGFCAMGSVKANIGHLGEAAGIAGLIKTVLALEHRQLPPSINYERPNPEIDFANSPVFVNAALRDWTPDGPRIAGITALGAGGTNAHVIVEEAPGVEHASALRAHELLVLSAKSQTALDQMTERLALHLEEHPNLPLADVAHTLQVGRRQFSHRRSFVASDARDAARTIRTRDAKNVATFASKQASASLVFMFPGGGAQYVGMGRELYASEPVYRSAVDEALGVLEPKLGATLRALILSANTDPGTNHDLERPSLSLHSVFATSYAVAKLLMSWGLEPAAMIGHSMGEYVAATLAGVMTVREAQNLLALRGRIFEAAPAGGMLSVALAEKDLTPLLPAELCLAAVNAPEACTVSGPLAAIEAFEKLLTERDIDSTRIRISVAAHSSMLDPFLPEFERFCRTIALEPPTVPFMSNLTGTWISAEDAVDPLYWVRHLRQSVRFADGLAEVLRGGQRVLLEVGPGRTLSSLSRMQSASVAAFSTLRHPQETVSDVKFLLQSLGKLWIHGIKPDWTRFRAQEQRRRVSLPTYPFERQRYWVERGNPLEQSGKAAPVGAPKKKADVADWFYLPSFRRSVVTPKPDNHGPWLLLCDEAGVGDQLAKRLSGPVVRVRPGREFAKLEDDLYTIGPSRRSDYEALLEELQSLGKMPEHIVHLWALSAKPRFGMRVLSKFMEQDGFEEMQARCFDSLFCLAQALSAHEQPLTLSVVTNDLHALGDEAAGDPLKALVLGPTRVIPREMPHVKTRHVDVSLAGGRTNEQNVLESLVSELNSEATDPVVLYRGLARSVLVHDAVSLPPASGRPASLRERGVYLITGGLGGIGLVVAEHLARLTKARLVLLGRSPVPPREQWDAWLSSHASNEPTSHRIQKLRAIERLGGEVLTVSADVTDRVQMEGALATARERFGAIHGIVHSAGTIDDNLIAMKTLESAHGVLATKVRGALVLDELLKREPLDFFVLFSSVSSLLGLEGQVDYTAANAFLDAFARQKAASGTRAVAINWNAWQSVGMAMVLADKSRLPITQTGGTTGPHPMLTRVLEDSQAESFYSTSFSRSEHWLLSEHVVHGAEALIPGTGYLELARGALEHHPEPGSAVELSNVFFLSPFTVRVGEARELKLRLKRSGPAAGEFSFVSHLDEAPHCTGRVRYVAAPEPGRQDLERLQARCTARIVHVEGFIDQQFVDFGPRWGNVRQIAYGDREALIRLELPSGYDSDLSTFRLHPALLDMATGGGQALVRGFDQSKDFFVPFSYGRLVLLRALPAKLVSHVRYKQSGAEGLATFDITLYDADGLEVAVINDFVMKRIEQAFAVADEPSAQSARSHMTHLGSVVQHGILPEEGMDALDRILASRLDREIVACSVDLHDWQRRVEAEAEARTRSNESAAGEGSGFARPNLSTTYLAPRDDVERELVSMWRELLGVGEVGAHDDFFELGGQSLIAVRLFNKIRRRYSVDLPLSTLFEAPTIARCAEVIREEAGLPELQPDSPGNGEPLGEAESAEPAARPLQKRSRWGSLVAIQPTGELPPFFCVAGMGGTLNNLRTLALLMGKERPFFGLQPPGADDPKQRLYRVEDLAAHYLREIRAVQPHGPYFLGGYSGGGVAAFEMSRQLEADGESVAFLAFLDSFSPSLPMRPVTDRALIHLRRMQAQGASYFTGALGRRLDYQKQIVTRRAQRELGRLFPQKYRYQNLGDSWVIAESHYQPTSWSGRATLFRAHEESALSLWTAYIVDEQHGWGRYVTGGVDVVLCAGNHQTMCEEPFVRDLAQKLRSAMDAHTPRPDARDNGTDRSAPVSSSMGPAHAP